MRGIQYINDGSGNRSKAVVDLSLYAREFAVFLEELAKKYGNTETVVETPTTTTTGSNSKQMKVDALIKAARSFYGTPYRTGGTTSSGMDCSGLTQTVFKMIGVNIPRVSRDQATIGTAVEYNGIQAGDLLFFATGTPNYINHVAVVSSVEGGDVKFVHASTSKGVMESSMSLDYWKKAYMTARRILV